MEEKRYLKWYNKVGYGSGDFAGNVVYAFLSSFVMLYLTNTVGLNPGIIGTLIMVSKLFDGISDMFFGTMIDKTKSRLGKARPWMLYAYIGCAVTLVANFAIPDSLSTTAQYVWFFIAYTLLNAVFFTANNIAYASLVTFCTKNSRERVEMGSWRFIFAFSTSLLIQSVTVQFVSAAGGGAAAWRMVAVVYAIIGLVVNTISVLSIKELSEEELRELYNSAIEAQVAALKIGNLTRASGCQEIANKIKGMQDPYTQKICLQEQRKFFENGLRSLQADKEMLKSIYKENSNAGTGYEKEEFAKLIAKKSRQTELVEPMYKKDMAEPEAQEI